MPVARSEMGAVGDFLYVLDGLLSAAIGFLVVRGQLLVAPGPGEPAIGGAEIDHWLAGSMTRAPATR